MLQFHTIILTTECHEYLLLCISCIFSLYLGSMNRLPLMTVIFSELSKLSLAFEQRFGYSCLSFSSLSVWGNADIAQKRNHLSIQKSVPSKQMAMYCMHNECYYLNSHDVRGDPIFFDTSLLHRCADFTHNGLCNQKVWKLVLAWIGDVSLLQFARNEHLLFSLWKPTQDVKTMSWNRCVSHSNAAEVLTFPFTLVAGITVIESHWTQQLIGKCNYSISSQI